MNAIFERIQGRRLFQWAIAYVAGGWLLLELLGFVADNFGWPGSIVRGATVLLGVGFFVTLVLAWYHGEKGHQRVGGVELLMLAALLLIAGVAVRQVTDSGAAADASSETVLAPPLGAASVDGASIAVLPFENQSAEPENEYFSDGITEDITNLLAQLKGLRVAARTSSFAFKGKAQDVGEVGAKLKVETVLEGSVRKAGTQLRVTAQLINVADGYHIWSEQYDREMDDVFTIQDEIARTIAHRLEVALSPGTHEPLVRPPTGNLEAYQLYLKGRHLWNRRTKEGLERAVEYFERAIKHDPEYALAYSGLADAYLLLGAYLHMPQVEANERAKAAAEKALALDETLAEAHTSLGQARRRECDWQGEEREYLRALELNPSYATARQWYAGLLALLGRLDEALREIRHAEELDPLSHAISVTAGMILTQSRDYDAAIEQLQRTLELEPDFFSAYAWLAIAYAHQDKFRESQQAAERLRELRPDHPAAHLILALTFARSGQREKAGDILEQLKEQGAEAGAIGVIHAGLGQLDEAFEWLHRAAKERSWILSDLKVSPWFDPVRSDPRYQDLLRQLNLPT